MSEKKQLGRPEYEPTDEDREKVAVLKASGLSHEAIAVAIGISPPTLRKHFFAELEKGGAAKVAEVMMARYRAAMGGNVTAQNRFLEQAGVSIPAQGEAVPVPKQEKLGKKEAANREAQTAHEDSSWGELVH